MKGASIIIGICLAVGAGLSGKGCESTGGGSGYPTITVTNRDFGDTISVKVGQDVDIALAENPSTGFTWHCNWRPVTGVKLVRRHFVGDRPGVPGAGGTRHFVVRAPQPGLTEVTLQLGRWPNGGKEPPRTINISASR